MPSSKEFIDFVVDQSGLAGDLTSRPMMGEFLLYYRGALIGGIYDNRLLLKKNAANASLGLCEAIPYQGAKTLLFVNVDDHDEVRKAILATAEGIKG